MEAYNYSIRKPGNFVILEPGVQRRVGGLAIEPFEVIHSLRCPAVCYKIKNAKTILYVPDIVDIKESKEQVFKGIDILVADGSSISINMVRQKDGKLFGHAMIKTIVNWCKKYNIPKLIITHIGKQIVSMPEEEAIEKIYQYSDGMPDFLIAYDGMIIDD